MAKRTKIARYNKRIQFFFVNPDDPYTYDDGGNLVPNFVPFKKRYCNKKNLVGISQEKTESLANTATKRVRLALRYTQLITNDMCFYCDGEVYDVITVGDPDGFGKETIIMGEVKADGGRN
ncbi:head-tail adaptor protein [Vagococcus sp. BWB3-3]|uniref:Head-tail adaptor protein n=1 Tax=Vagococcus allomyrinae TaxID=2794353 RepID=A0A940P2Q2_9ENTE|nr:head-tail adaptor protein [Vagococcus allomyrinae]MBP1040369.1 head-tail adaptor protein [Vagococcus allomyrinae]